MRNRNLLLVVRVLLDIPLRVRFVLVLSSVMVSYYPQDSYKSSEFRSFCNSQQKVYCYTIAGVHRKDDEKLSSWDGYPENRAGPIRHQGA